MYGGETAPVTNNVMILGVKVEEGEDGQAILSDTARQRADRFLDYYHNVGRVFNCQDAWVVCSGGTGTLARGVELPDNPALREGRAIADYLVKNDIPHSLIRVEDTSISTLTNFINSINLDYFKPEQFNARHPLGVVTHPHHQKRVQVIGDALGFTEKAIKPINAKGPESGILETAFRDMYKVALAGVKKEETMLKREALILKGMNSVRGLIAKS